MSQTGIVARLTSVDAATGETIGSLPVATPADIDRAVRDAHEVIHGSWALDHAARARALNAWADLLEHHLNEVADLLMRETGKVLPQARGELFGCIDEIRYNAGMARLPLGEAGALSDGTVSHVERSPIGVCAFISPWNAPLILLTRDLATALAVGAGGVVKPAAPSSMVTQRYLELAVEAGIPAAAVGLVAGSGAVLGPHLVQHPLVRLVAFTGSTDTGVGIMQLAAPDMTHVHLELGGKSPSIVFGDADIERAVDRILFSSFFINGQFCMASSRILIEREVFRNVMERIVARARALRVDRPGAEGADLGPLITRQQRESVMRYVAIADADGQVAYGGEALEVDGLPGAFMTPTIIAGDDVDPRLTTEEIFGPVVVVEPFDGEDDAVRRANSSPFGLAASVWTSDSARAWRVGRGVRAGHVWVNHYGLPGAEFPSGGFGASGIGRSRGRDGLLTFTEAKQINFDISA